MTTIDHDAADNAWSTHPVDSSVTQGAGIPDADLDKLIAATRGSTTNLSVADDTIADMTTTTLANMPAGAADAIEAPDSTRVIFSERHHTGSISVCASAIQPHPGSHRLELASVQLGGGNQELTPAQARLLAAQLIEAADQADIWAAMSRHPASRTK